MLVLLSACTSPPTDGAPSDIDTSVAHDTASWDTAPEPEAPAVAFLDPRAGEVFTPEQDIRVEVLAGDEGALDALALAWGGDVGASELPSAPDADGRATFEIPPLSLGDYTVSVIATDADGLTAYAEVPFSVVVLDADGDGFTNAALRGDDCDDANAAVNPDATEVCDEVDNDCDDRVDEGVTDPYYADADGDGFGASSPSIAACAASPGWVADDTDCDDTHATVFPGNPETCDELDNDCDAAVDEDVQLPFYRDDDGDGFGTDADLVWACAAPPGYVSPSGDCDDTTVATSPAETEICLDGLDNDCDGTSNSCALSGTVDLGVADAKLRGSDAGDWLGSSVGAAGDVDGDGLADLLLGAPGAASGAGGAYVFLGPVSGTLASSSADGAITGESASDAAGYSVAPAGDFDGDGLADVIVGAYGNDGAGTDAGAAYVLSGAALGSWSLASAGLTVEGADAGDQAGVAVAGAGDVDGDGNADVLVGAWMSSDGGAFSGGAWLVSGPRTGTVDLSSADAAMVGEAAGDFAGQALSGAGDVDGDGYDDVLVGAPGTGSGTGTAYLLLGPLSGTIDLSAADARFEGEVEDDAAGAAVAAAGDVDGDGNLDILVGATGYDYAGRDTGSGFLVLGPFSGTLGLASADALLVGEHAGNNAGWSVGSAGDMDGDGKDDVLVGAPREDSGGTASGAAYLVYGPVASLFDLGSADARLLGEATDDYAGTSVAGVGDTDGDGKGDILVGAPYEDAGVGSRSGAAYLVLGTGL